MEFQAITKQLNKMETVFDDVMEQPLDCDFVLPDYLPDIAAVLKCILRPVVQSKQISGDRVAADGTVGLQILYLDEERTCVRSFETTQPFSCSFTVKEMNNNDSVELSTSVNYVNCRATGPRRVDIHGAFGVKVMVRGERCKTILDSQNDSALQTKEECVSFTRLVGEEEKSFTVTEIVELENVNDAQMLIRTGAVPRVTECKVLPGKAVVKGEIVLESVYTVNEEGTLGSSRNVILFSQIVDLHGLNEECLCECRASMMYCETHPAQTPVGESKLLSFSGKVLLSFRAYETQTDTLITDAYHTQFPLKTIPTTMEFCCIEDISCHTETLDVSVELPDNDIVSVDDLWCDVVSVSSLEEGRGKCAEILTSVCMLGRDSRNCFAFYERPAKFSLPLTKYSDRMVIDAECLTAEWKISGNRVELKITFLIHCRFENVKRYAVLCEVEKDEKLKYRAEPAMEECCMKVYFATAGERVWDIAKRQHIALKCLCEENDILGTDKLSENKMLILPMV